MNCYIYSLIDPDTKEIRYIGKTNNPKVRYSAHIYYAKKNKQTYCSRWIRGLIISGKKPTMETLEVVDEKDWREKEIEYISKYRATNNLANLSDGGGGVNIKHHNKEWVSNIVKSRKSNAGYSPSLTTRNKISETLLYKSDIRGCKRGHPWTIENTIYEYKNGKQYRLCRECKNSNQRSLRVRLGKIKGRKKTYCKRGHPLYGDNLRILTRTKNGKLITERICRMCVRARNKESKKRKQNERTNTDCLRS